MINSLKKFCSFGFSKDGSSQLIWQRISALLLIFLFSWIIFSLQKLLINFTTDFYAWIKIPINMILFITLFKSLFELTDILPIKTSGNKSLPSS